MSQTTQIVAKKQTKYVKKIYNKNQKQNKDLSIHFSEKIDETDPVTRIPQPDNSLFNDQIMSSLLHRRRSDGEMYKTIIAQYLLPKNKKNENKIQ